MVPRSSRSTSPEVEVPSSVFSTFRPNENNIFEQDDGSIMLKLLPAERLTVVGEYDLVVHEGEITIMGATLLPFEKLHRVYAPSSHSLPVIRCAANPEVEYAKLQLRQTSGGLGSLKNLSPLFGKMFDKYLGPLGKNHKYRRTKGYSGRHSTFQLVYPYEVRAVVL